MAHFKKKKKIQKIFINVFLKIIFANQVIHESRGTNVLPMNKMNCYYIMILMDPVTSQYQLDSSSFTYILIVLPCLDDFGNSQKTFNRDQFQNSVKTTFSNDYYSF